MATVHAMPFLGAVHAGERFQLVKRIWTVWLCVRRSFFSRLNPWRARSRVICVKMLPPAGLHVFSRKRKGAFLQLGRKHFLRILQFTHKDLSRDASKLFITSFIATHKPACFIGRATQVTKNGNKPSYLQLGPSLQSHLLLQSTAGAALSFMCTSVPILI